MVQLQHFLEAYSEQSAKSHREGSDSYLTLELGKRVRE